MSSSQQQPTNPNNNNNNTNINQTQIVNNNAYGDYVEYPTNAPYTTSTIDPQSQYETGIAYNYTTDQVYTNDDDDDILSDFENEFSEVMGNEEMHPNYEDESIYTDEVQNAFSKYEEEQLSRYWTTNKSNWENFTAEEQERMIDEMQECMMHMTQEYAAINTPSDTERQNVRQLNPDAAEFRPSWLPASEPLAEPSSVPFEAEKPGEGEE